MSQVSTWDLCIVNAKASWSGNWVRLLAFPEESMKDSVETENLTMPGTSGPRYEGPLYVLASNFTRTAIGAWGGPALSAKMISCTTPIAPLTIPAGSHKFCVQMTGTPTASETVDCKPPTLE
jgi:hypothetical protein